jgi:DNA-binding CsgD family transcriptional regulator/tetratricopeptide (TPR) repeat protein
VFVGRQAELDVVSRALEAVRGGQPQIVWIEGEPGIGKTAFVRRCLSEADGLVVVEASGDESELTFEYGVVSQLISRAAPRGGGNGLSERISAGSPASVFAVGAELLGLLGSLQDASPVVVAIDDAQWLDAPSAGALLFALRRLHAADRVLVLTAARPDAIELLGPSWSKLLNDSNLVRRMTLPGLTGPEVVQLAESLEIGQLTLAAGERLREHTGGHPLYVRALLSEIPLETLNFAHESLPAPHSFAATVLAKMATVSTDAQNLVAAAAAAGVRAPLRLAAAAAGSRDPLAALEEALAAELLVLVPGHTPPEITFPHPLLRAAVYDDLSPTRRRELHLACARLTSGSVSLGHRVAATPGADDELATELERAAQKEVSTGHLRAGVERMMWAAQVAGNLLAREDALLRAVELLLLAGDLPAAQSHREDVVACSDSPRRSYVIAAIAATEGRLLEAVDAARRVLERPDFAESAELEASVAALLSIACAFMARGEEAVQWADRALAHEDCPPTAMVVASQGRLVGLAMLGRGDEAIATLGHLSASRIDPEPFEAELLVSRGNIKTYWGDLPGALEDLSTAIRWSRAGAQVRSVPNAYAALAETEYRLGRWEDALTHADVAVSLGEDSDRVWDLPFVHAVASYPNSSRGNFAVAADHVEAARRTFELAPLPMGFHYATVADAHLAWARGDAEAVLRLLAPANNWVGWGDVTGLGQRIPRLLYAEAVLATGGLDEAASVLDAIDEATRERQHELTRVDLWRLRGMLAQARGQAAEARRAFAEGKEAARMTEAPFNEALLDLANGVFLRKAGSRRSAIATLRTARTAFARLGAIPSLERCDAELAACGVSSRPRGGDDRYDLTAREGVVARLVASGKSNREVAEELYLSTKAIEYHLGNVFAKLNIRSRHELAARLGTGSNGEPLEPAPATT